MITTTLIALTLTVTPTHSGWEQTVPEVHVVKAGESLSSLDTSEGSPGPWTRLAFVNRDAFEDPNVIDVGTVLVIPHADGRRLQWTPPPPSPSSSWTSSGSPSAGGSTGGNWDAIAACESGGDWSYNGSSGYDGGLQFLPSSWLAYGGGEYAPEAWMASKAEQIAVAERMPRSSWPNC